MGQPVSGNVLDNASVPAGTTASVAGFVVDGSTKVYAPNGSPVPLTDPATGLPVGTITMQPSGAYTFTPAPGYVGPVPAINLYLKSTDSSTAVSSLTIDVIPGEVRAKVCVPWLNQAIVVRPGVSVVPTLGTLLLFLYALQHRLSSRARSAT